MDVQIDTSLPGAGAAGLASRENQVYRLADGRQLGFAEYGAPGGYPVFAFHGTPGSRLMYQLADAPARQRDLRLIAPERPGYAFSCIQPERQLTDWPRDVAELADHLGIDRFGVVGVSGGGAYGAACASRLKARVSATALVSPVGPFGHPDLVPQLKRTERHLFNSIARSTWRSRMMFGTIRWFQTNAPGLAIKAVITRSGRADRDILRRPEVAANLVEALSEGLRPGLTGAMQDLRLYADPWNLPLHEVEEPCAIWHGSIDHIVPPAAAQFLSRQIPASTYVSLPGAGHYWVFNHFDQVLDWLVRCTRQTEGAGKVL